MTPGPVSRPRGRREQRLLVVDEGDPTDYPELDTDEATVILAASAMKVEVLLDKHTHGHWFSVIQGSARRLRRPSELSG